MTVKEALIARSSKRDFTPTLIPRGDIEEILKLAGNAPSGANMQPWLVKVVQGEKLIKTGEAVIDYMRTGAPLCPDYDYYPLSWFAPYKERRVKTGKGLYEILGIASTEKERRNEQWEKNFRWFGATTVLFVCYHNRVSAGSFIDLGGFMQSVCLAATEKGIGSCIQASTAEYAAIIKKELDIPEDQYLAYSIVLGYPTDVPENSYKPERIELDQFVTFMD